MNFTGSVYWRASSARDGSIPRRKCCFPLSLVRWNLLPGQFPQVRLAGSPVSPPAGTQPRSASGVLELPDCSRPPLSGMDVRVITTQACIAKHPLTWLQFGLSSGPACERSRAGLQESHCWLIVSRSDGRHLLCMLSVLRNECHHFSGVDLSVAWHFS